MSEEVETRALERLMVRRGEMPPAVTIEPPGDGEGPDVAAGRAAVMCRIPGSRPAN